MIHVDANILIYVCRREMKLHTRCKEWLETSLESGEIVGVSDIVVSAVTRITSHPKIFNEPLPIAQPLQFFSALFALPNVRRIAPGPRHWSIFTDLCLQSGARGNLVQDAYLAALAIEQDAEWVSADTDFARFPTLKWRRLS